MAGYNDSVKSANVITGILSNATLQGDSAYEVAVKNGFVGTEAEWLASLKGDQGDQGIQGPIGPTGPTGATGNGISTIDMGSSGWMSIHTTDGTDYSFYVKGDKGNKGDTGVGISTVLLNSDYTLTITLTDGDTYTTDPIRGAKGETGTGITDVELNSDYTLTITMSDGTSYTTGSIRGEKGDKGDTGSKGDKGTSISSVTKTGTSGLVDTYTITYDDGTTSTFTVTNGQNATVEVTSDTDSDYRLTFTDVNGSIETPNLYSDVTASAKQLLSESYTLDQVPYLYRKSPDSDRAVEEIVGGTVGWNQLVQNGNFESTSGWIGANCTISASSNIMIATSTTDGSMSHTLSQTVTVPSEHKVLVRCFVKSEQANSARCRYPFVGASKTMTANAWYDFCDIGIASSNNVGIQCNAINGNVIQYRHFICSDLTVDFGSTIADYIYSLETATAGAGVAKLKEWGFFTEDYYEYCEPTLRSVEGLVRKKTVGFNCWDEEWEVGAYNNNGGKNDNVTTSLRCKNPIPVFPNTDYYFGIPLVSPAHSMRRVFYDADMNCISSDAGQGTNMVFTTPSNARYFAFNIGSTYGTTYNHDICINLSDPTRNGQYEPYESHSYSLDSTLTLRGVPKLDSNNNLYFDGDIYPADGQGKRRFGEYTFTGSETWGFASTFFYFLYDFGGLKHSGSCITSNGIVTRLNANPQGLRVYLSDNPQLSSESDMSAFFKSGTKAVYELATPTTFTATPYHNPQIVGDTEEFVTTGIVPVGHETKYFLDLRSRIEGLPDDFSTLIAPTEVTNKATKNYTKGELLILNNQLYKVTSAIANNGTITVNTNVRATTIAQEISPLVPPTTNGTYVLKATVSNGNVTYSWVAG